jgi:tetratricopeptide (TPR) repeat protein
MSLLSTTPAHAWWHHHCGWRGCGYGYGGYGWRGCGYGGGWCGYGGYGGYGYPGYSVGYFPRYYGSFGYGYPYYGYSAPIGIGIGYRPLASTYNPSVNMIVSAAPATAPAATVAARLNQQPLTLQNFLGLKELRPISLKLPVKEAPAVRLANADARRKAERMIVEGDALFRAQNFHSALQKYKLAASTAPDLAEAHWRQGHALVATHNFDLAAGAFKRAVALTDDLARGGFRLSDLYGNASMTKTAHLESLAEWAMTRRDWSDPYFLLGLFLTYDGDPARAERFFQRAADLAGIAGGHIAVFLAPVEEPARPVANQEVAPRQLEVKLISAGTEI